MSTYQDLPHTQFWAKHKTTPSSIYFPLKAECQLYLKRKNYSFKRKSYRETGRDGERDFIHCFTPQMATTAGVGHGWRLEPRSHLVLPQVAWAILCFFQRRISWGLVRSGGARLKPVSIWDVGIIGSSPTCHTTMAVLVQPQPTHTASILWYYTRSATSLKIIYLFSLIYLKEREKFSTH